MLPNTSILNNTKNNTKNNVKSIKTINENTLQNLLNSSKQVINNTKSIKTISKINSNPIQSVYSIDNLQKYLVKTYGSNSIKLSSANPNKNNQILVSKDCFVGITDSKFDNFFDTSRLSLLVLTEVLMTLRAFSSAAKQFV
jgi:hypothetical protein